MEFVQAASQSSRYFPSVNDRAEEIEEATERIFPSSENPGDINSRVQTSFKKQQTQECLETFESENFVLKPVPQLMQLFYAQFQKKFRRFNLVYNEDKETINCNQFPFSWTNFEFTGAIKVSFPISTNWDYQGFRQENLSEFIEIFRNHKAYWSFPYNTIVIYGNEVANGINPVDTSARVKYMCYLLEELRRFFQPVEDVLFTTPLFGKERRFIA